ncbi:MAG: ATP-binding protein [Bacteroidia bacterium]
MLDFFKGLFDTSGFPPRWHCGQWTEFHGWFYIISDLLIWSAYFAIPIIIVSYISRRKELRFHRIYFLFAAFILACGLTHLLDAIIFWYPFYRLSALIRFITGVLSWLTVYNLFKMLPAAFSLKSSKELEAEVEQRKKAEEELKFKNQKLNEAQEIARMGHWEWNVATNKVIWSDQLFRMYGMSVSEEGLSYEKFLEHVHPDDRANVDTCIKQAFTEKKFSEYYHRIITADGKTKMHHARGEVITNANGEVIKMIGTGQDVTEQKKTEKELLIKSADLEAMNTELQKFAYVASHDLQEPLRKIKTYISRLQGVGADEIHEPQREQYREKIIDAADRMQKLIEDILNFSKMSSATYVFEKTDLSLVLKNVLSDMEVVIEKSNAKIIADPLPVIEGNNTQMGQLFQNLIGNAIKFRSPDTAPQIEIRLENITGSQIEVPFHIKAHYKFAEWDESNYWGREKFYKITVRDNGIGFEPKYAERIFEAFQRLSTHTKYEGTGIGLAICKKIVDNHHGLINATSEPGKGTVFNLILPSSQVNFERNIKQN